MQNKFFNFIKQKANDISTGLFFSRGSGIGYGNKSASDFLAYNEASLYVNRAIDTRAEKIGEVKFVLKKGDKVIEDNEFLNLLNKPNKFHTGKQFWKLYQKYYDITGSAYILKVGKKPELFEKNTKIEELHLLRPDCVTIKYNETNTDIVSFEYKNGDKTFVYSADQVIYSFNPDPMNPLIGASLLKAGVRAIETEIQIAEYQNKILKNGGQVDSVFTFKGNLNAQQIKDMKEQWKDNSAGAENAGKPLFLGGEADVKRLALNPNELSFLTSKGITLEDICILTGVPKEILGTTSGSTYANADASIAIFLRERIKPMLQELVTLLDWRLIPEDMDLTFIDPTPENHDIKIKTAETLNTINAITTNEKREMFGFDPVEGGDDVLIPFSLTPLNGAPDTTPAPTDNAQKSIGAHPLKDKILRKKYAQIMVKRMDRREGMFLKVMRDYFDEQKTRLIDSLSAKKQFKTKSILGEIFDNELEIKLAKSAILPAIKQIFMETASEAYKLVSDKPYKFTLTSEIESWLNNKASIFSNQITDTTFEKLKNQFTQSFEAQETRPELVARIKDVYGDFDSTRAKTIARTEVHGATTKGTMEGYKQAGMKTKIWVAVMDDVTRDSHAMTDGEEVPIDHAFSNGLDYPSDPSAPAEETINCRCVI